MSGHKRATISITQDEYDRLRDAELKMRMLPEPTIVVQNEAVERSTRALLANLQQMEKRQGMYENMLANMDDYVRQVETSTSQAMLDYETAALSQVQEYAGCLWNHYDRLLAEDNQYFIATIEAAQRENREQLTLYARQVRKMAGDQQRKQEIALEWLSAAEQLAQFIDTCYDHAMFTPGRLEQLESQLDQARLNLEIGLPEAVIVAAQQIYSALSDLRIQLEQAQNEWSMLLQASREAVNQLIQTAGQTAVIQAIDLDGNPLPFDIDVDYWSEGRLTQIEGDLAYAHDLLESNPKNLNSDTLRHWLDVDLPQYAQVLEDTVFHARISALNSQLRINIADLVVQALQDQGFALETSQYQATDQRAAYGARLVNLEGNEIIVKVAPTGPELGENELHVQSLDKQDRTEHELQQRWYEVSRSLGSYGLQVGSFVHEDAAPYETGRSVREERAAYGTQIDYQQPEPNKSAKKKLHYQVGKPHGD